MGLCNYTYNCDAITMSINKKLTCDNSKTMHYVTHILDSEFHVYNEKKCANCHSSRGNNVVHITTNYL